MKVNIYGFNGAILLMNSYDLKIFRATMNCRLFSLNGYEIDIYELLDKYLPHETSSLR